MRENRRVRCDSDNNSPLKFPFNLTVENAGPAEYEEVEQSIDHARSVTIVEHLLSVSTAKDDWPLLAL
ncbi:hypothetical protein H6F43_20870 [Leptolyngbya sp. FACHB-36]|nr:hypothetical protein [Leptolyngbya sp. FACHB-36]